MFFSFGYEVTYSLNFSCAFAHSPSVMRSRALRNTVMPSLPDCCVARLTVAEVEVVRCWPSATLGATLAISTTRSEREILIIVFDVRFLNIYLASILINDCLGPGPGNPKARL